MTAPLLFQLIGGATIFARLDDSEQPINGLVVKDARWLSQDHSGNFTMKPSPFMQDTTFMIPMHALLHEPVQVLPHIEKAYVEATSGIIL